MNIKEEIKHGIELLNQGNYLEAIQKFNEILFNDKSNYNTINYLAVAYSMLQKYNEAIEALNSAIELQPSFPNAYLNLAIILFQKGEKEESLKYYKLAIERDQNNSNSYFNFAVALNELGFYEEAKTNYEKAIELNSSNYLAQYNLGLLNLLLGNYKNGWKGYEYRVEAEVVKKRVMPGKKWNGETAKNSTLYVYPNQGFGDTIQFVRFLPIIKQRVEKLIFECQPSLYSLFEELPYFDEIVEMQESLEPVKTYDYCLPITSLGSILSINQNSTVWEKPYLSANSKLKYERTNYLKNITEKKIGLVWRSNSNYKLDEKRAFPLKKLQKIFSVKNIKFYSLQMEPTTEEIEYFKKYDIKDLSSELKNFSDTAQIIEEMDLIISTDTAVPHLAGAMGKQTWLLLSSQPDWRWQVNKSDSFWYPSLKLFRQKEHGNWTDVVDSIYHNLNNLVNENLRKNTKMEIFTDEGMERFKDFLLKIKEDTYPETPLEFHTQISDKMISELINKIELPQNARILDIGCGQGLGLRKFSDYGFNPVGITLNATDYEICKNQGFEVYQMDQSFLQFNENEFDFLWARHVLEHSIFPYYTLHEYSRVLKKNGLVYIEVPAAGFDAVHENNPNHYSILTKTMWYSLFNKAGFNLLYELDFDLELEKNGKDQYWMFILNKRNEEKNAK